MNTKKKITKIAISLTLAMLSFSAASFAGTFPKTPQELTTKSAEEMKSYSDTKVALNKPLSPISFKGKTETELSLMRNSIYAQVGLSFTEPWLKNYFLSRSWYKEGKYSSKSLTKIDFENIKMIYDYQKSNHLLTLFTPVPKSIVHKGLPVRKSASQPDELKLKDKDLRAALLKMKYCDYMVDNTPVYKMTFHHNNIVTLKYNEDASSGAYDSAYTGGASEGGEAYSENAYEGSTSNTGEKSTWKIINGRVIVNLTGGPDQVVSLTEASLTKHLCY